MNRSEEIRIMSLPGMQEKFREAMGELLPDDKSMCPKGVVLSCRDCSTKLRQHDEDCYRKPMIYLPLPIDPVNPERGLVGMLKDFEKLYYSRKDGWVCLHDSFHFYGATPTLALLKALAHQWKAEVEG